MRSVSCRAVTSRRAASSASASTLPFRRSVNGMLYVADAPSSLCRNHSRRCAKDNGIMSCFLLPAPHRAMRRWSVVGRVVGRAG
ncbi:hypothetical protein ADK78_16490 [Kitasatospora aureofaciens]|nr:hypothetical protein ADK78_16490 [Kitasatospora aureofaciens]KOT62191.1 hypothetical protein ADK44_12455 [Streptomyces rimosus subsp. rimosus]